MFKRLVFALIGLCVCVISSTAQPLGEAPKPAVDHSYKPLTIKLSEDGSKYMRFIMWHQFWLTHTFNNPGTVDVNGLPQESTSDIALRRSRVLWYAQVSPRFLILTHYGINNQSFVAGGGNGQGASGTDGKKPQLFIHDAWSEYEIVKDKLYLGTGLHYWNGVSRMASASTLNFMALDAPIFNWYNIEQSDQFARQFGIYAKGQVGKWDYRVSLNKPFMVGRLGVAPTGSLAVGAAALNNYARVNSGISEPVKTETWATQGYIAYQVWDKENNKLPFYVGSHLGAKKVLNFGGGWYQHNDVMGSLTATVDGDTLRNFNLTKHAQGHWGVDGYLDMPISAGQKKGCLHAYVMYQNMNFGPDYVRNIGILNLHATATGSDRGYAAGGNAQPTLGTGQIVYGQFGYAPPKFANGTQIMPYVNVTYKDFEGLDDASTQVDAGLNYFINNHHAKVTLQYSQRPTYNLDRTRGDSKGEIILQTHIFL
jgi:hypothetical protein